MLDWNNKERGIFVSIPPLSYLLNPDSLAVNKPHRVAWNRLSTHLNESSLSSACPAITTGLLSIHLPHPQQCMKSHPHLLLHHTKTYDCRTVYILCSLLIALYATRSIGARLLRRIEAMLCGFSEYRQVCGLAYSHVYYTIQPFLKLSTERK